jgi:hypothetical protein
LDHHEGEEITYLPSSTIPEKKMRVGRESCAIDFLDDRGRP